MPSEYLTVEQTAARLSRHAETIRRMIRDGQLEVVKLGKKYLVSEAAIKKLLGETSAPAAAPASKPAQEKSPKKTTAGTAKTVARKKK